MRGVVSIFFCYIQLSSIINSPKWFSISVEQYNQAIQQIVQSVYNFHWTKFYPNICLDISVKLLIYFGIFCTAQILLVGLLLFNTCLCFPVFLPPGLGRNKGQLKLAFLVELLRDGVGLTHHWKHLNEVFLQNQVI